MDDAVEVRDVSKTYISGTVALDHVSLKVKAGEFVCLVGPSGCGKSTLLKMVAGLIPCTSGEIFLYGSRMEGPRTDIGMIPQSPSLLDWRNVIDNIMLPVEILKREIEEYRKKAGELIELTGLTGFEHSRPFELSGGMQQRVSICRALIYEPKLILADEPFASLDAFTRRRMGLEFTRIWDQYKREILFVTHDIPEAVLLADRIVVMSPRPGRIIDDIQIGLSRPRNQVVRDSVPYSEYVSRIGSMITTELQSGETVVP